ncbi:hypothetical protein C7M52_00180 [Mixta theicola]|nr:hypothetical protein C7M52_00180 [Mixta theicola]
MLPGIADITLCADVQSIIYDYQTRIIYPNASAIGNAHDFIGIYTAHHAGIDRYVIFALSVFRILTIPARLYAAGGGP